MTQLVCQWLLLALLVVNFVVFVYRDFEGCKAKEPLGFAGFITSLLIACMAFCLFYFAGAFSCIFH